MERDDIIECVVTRHDEDGTLWVQHGDVIGLVDASEIAWNSKDIPTIGDHVHVAFRFATGSTPKNSVPFDFVGSIKDAYPEKHPIHLVDESIIGSQFISRLLSLGPRIAVKHPCGLVGLLQRTDVVGIIEPGSKALVETTGIDRAHNRLLVRFVQMVEAETVQ